MNVLSHEGASKVFYELAAGRKTPKDLSKALSVRPPTVAEQLAKLEKTKLVIRGKKEGKFQEYEVDWAEVAKVSLNHFPELDAVLGIYADPDHGIEDVDVRRLLLHFKERLATNEAYIEFVSHYFISLADVISPEGYNELPNIEEAFEQLENAILRLFTLIRPPPKSNNALRELYEFLEIWFKYSIQTDPTTRFAAKEALSHVGLPTGV